MTCFQGPFALLLWTLVWCFGSVKCLENPTIQFEIVGNSWERTTDIDKTVTLYSSIADDLIVSCEAPFPIQWNITGKIVPSEVVKIQPPKRNLTANTFTIKINFFFFEAENFTGLAASAGIVCESVANEKVKDKFFAFVRGRFPFIPPETNVVTDSELIPCATTDPSIPTTLSIRDPNRTERPVQNVIYSKTEGFRSSKIFDGTYICKHGPHSVSFEARVSRITSDYQFSPTTGAIRAFADETIDISCSSRTNPIQLKFKEVENVKVKYSVDTEQLQVATLATTNVVNKPIIGEVVCINPGSYEVIKQWQFEFIEPPQLYLDNFEGEVDCLSTSVTKMVQTVRCINTMHCQFMNNCFRNVSFCNYKKQKQFSATKNTFCWVEKIQAGKECASVPYSHYNGIAQCTAGGLTRQWEYFVSLGLLRYSNWMDAPENELLRMDEVPEILYTNNSMQFFCMASAYLFTDSLSFQIEFQNGTREILENDGERVNITNPSSENPKKIDEFNVLGALDIMLPIETVGIHCLAPWWNSTDFMVTSRKFETRHLVAPVLINGNEDSTESFITGASNQRLTCHAKGEPKPIYQWLYKVSEFGYRNVSEIFPELKTSDGSRGEGNLEFVSALPKYSGDFKCLAINSVDRTSKIFTLKVADEAISGKSVVYISVVIIILFVLAVVLSALVIFMRRYKEARELVRSLTDSEIDEFFQGKPELLNDRQPTSTNTIEFLPFNNHYEIPVNDIEFDSSNQCLLGSGEFADVVKGKIISRGETVAVKISKPSADVSLFKSLLSEVKVMIYIGEYDNIIKLIGVSTENIRNRNIFIVTELCDLGSLDVFVRKGRRDFVNLIDANQAINTTLLPEGPVHLSTLDLINFSAQIAKGMEYLAFKSVVHADLATRNVLLTSDRVAKIADFGLSKKLYECNNYVKKSKAPLPWRWMAVESLTTLSFSSQSDVWSYGATLYEIFTLGDIPFPNEEWNAEFLQRLTSGMRMGRPKYSTQEIYSNIVTCWESDPDLRPTFTVLRTFFENLLRQYQQSNAVESNKNDSTENRLYVNHDAVRDVQTSYDKTEEIRKEGSDQAFSNSTENAPTAPSYVNMD